MIEDHFCLLLILYWKESNDFVSTGANGRKEDSTSSQPRNQSALFIRDKDRLWIGRIAPPFRSLTYLDRRHWGRRTAALGRRERGRECKSELQHAIRPSRMPRPTTTTTTRRSRRHLPIRQTHLLLVSGPEPRALIHFLPSGRPVIRRVKAVGRRHCDAREDASATFFPEL